MPCTSCGAEFGIFKKEHSCKNCGYTFCGNCLPKKIIVPKVSGQTKHYVCSRCYETLSNPGTSVASAQFSPPLALQRRMNVLQENQAGYLVKNNNTDKDKALATRLEKLRHEKQGPIPTTAELEERLAKLKGLNSETNPVPNQVFKVDRRTATEQASNLYDQMKEEVDLDRQRPKPELEIANRLARLKQDDQPWNDLNKPGSFSSEETKTVTLSSSSIEFDQNAESAFKPDILMNLPNNIGGDYSNVHNVNEVKRLLDLTSKQVQLEAEQAMKELEKDKEVQAKLSQLKVTNEKYNANLCVEDEDSEDDEKVSDKIIEKVLMEEALDKSSADILIERKSRSSPELEDMDELPWCNICNEDATLRCCGCDGELYCQRCFRECHDSLELKDHQTKKYKAPAVKM